MVRTTQVLLLSALLFTFNFGESVAQDSSVSSIVVVDNNVSGGGFQSDVTITDDGLTVYSAGDVSGVFKSTDGGLRYEVRNQGLRSSQVASIAITPDNPQIIYAGTGAQGTSGGLFRSIDGGETWALTGAGDNAQFAGNHSAEGDPVPDGHPRSNGDLVVVDPGGDEARHTDDIVIAGTYKTGVRIFIGGGEEEVSAVNTSGFVRSIAHDPSIEDTVYAAIQFDDVTKNGVYRINYSNLSAPTSVLEYQTLRPEGVTVLSNGHIYAAIGEKGIIKSNGLRFVERSAGLDTGNSLRQWTAITGYVRNGIDILYAGTNNLGGSQVNGRHSNIWRSLNGGNNWTPLVDANENVSDRIYGERFDWWFSEDAFTNAALGHSNSVVSSIEVARGTNLNLVSDDIIYVSGRGGIWKSDNGGRAWQPAVANMQATSNRGVAVNPNDPTQVVLANTDYVVLETNSRFEDDDIIRDRPEFAESRGYDVLFNSRARELVLGTGDRDANRGGEVFLKAATALGRDILWTKTGLEDVTPGNHGRVRAVAYGYHNGNAPATKTILAAVEGEGVYRYKNRVWRKSTGVTIGGTDRSNFVWPDSENSGVVYLLDLTAGLCRSNDGGRTWTNIWPVMRFNNNDFFNTGYITADDNDPTTLYVSVQGHRESPIPRGFRVFRLTQADTRIFGEPGTAGITDISSHSGNTQIRRPGPIVFGPEGNLWLTQQQDSVNSVDASLFVMENPRTDVTFKDVSSEEYRNTAISPSGIDVSTDRHVYVSQNGVGVVKARIVGPLDPAVLLGDVDQDGTVDLGDATPFTQLVMTGEYQLEADINGDGYVDIYDLDPFALIISMLAN